MSVYSLSTQSASKYYDKHLKNILDLSKKEYVQKYFKVGKKINEKEQMFSNVMIEFLATENCELLNYINNKLEGRLGHVSGSLQIAPKESINYNITQVIREKSLWEEVLW
jgi:tRNA G26 N,N-dimethylase Trm1